MYVSTYAGSSCTICVFYDQDPIDPQGRRKDYNIAFIAKQGDKIDILKLTIPENINTQDIVGSGDGYTMPASTATDASIYIQKALDDTKKDVFTTQGVASFLSIRE